MKHLLLSLLLFTLAGCQIDGLDPLNAKTVVPDVNARISRKLSVTGDGKTVYAEARYQYNTLGQLERINSYSWNSRNAKGPMILSYYETYEYNGAKLLSRKTSYYRSSNADDFRAMSMQNYSYPADGQIVDIGSGFNATTNTWYVASRTETFTENSRPMRVLRYVPNSSPAFVLQSTEAYTYKAGRLVTVEYKSPAITNYYTLVYTYKGRTAKIEAITTNTSQPSSRQELEYDRRGRLIRQQYVNYGIDRLYLSSSSSSLYIVNGNTLTVFEYDN